MIKSWPYPRVIAHRGGGNHAPENTLLALSVGKQHDYKGVEFDVMLSSDNIPMLMHDHVLERTIRHPTYSIQEPKLWFNQLLAHELMTIDAGSYYDHHIINENIPLFEDVMKYCIDHNIWMNIEIKPVPGYESITGTVVAEVTSKYFPSSSASSSEMTNYPLFSSFDYDALVNAKAAAPHIPRGYLIDKLDEVPNWRLQLQTIDAASLHVNYREILLPSSSQDNGYHINYDLVQEIKSLGYGLFCYTVNEVALGKLLLDAGIDAFCTDSLADMQVLSIRYDTIRHNIEDEDVRK